MNTIGNRFGSLALNIGNPLDKEKRKEKPKKKVQEVPTLAPKPAGPTKSSASPKKLSQKTRKVSAKLNSPQDKPLGTSDREPLPENRKKAATETRTKKESKTVHDPSPSSLHRNVGDSSFKVPEKQQQNGHYENNEGSGVVEIPTNLKSDNKRRGNNVRGRTRQTFGAVRGGKDQVPLQQPTTKLTDLDGEPAQADSGHYSKSRVSGSSVGVEDEECKVVQDLQKDDRALRGRSTYQRLVVNRGRVFERRHGVEGRVKVIEKKEGHGQFNWGERGTKSEGQEVVVDLDEDESHIGGDISGGETDVAEITKTEVKYEEEPEAVEYTLDQYKEMLRENKVIPVYRGNDPVGKSTVEGGVHKTEDKEHRNQDRPVRTTENPKSWSGEGAERPRGGSSRGSGFSPRTRGTRGGFGPRGRSRQDGTASTRTGAAAAYGYSDGFSSQQRKMNAVATTKKEILIDNMADFPAL